MKTYQVDRSKLSDGQLSKDIINLYSGHHVGKELAFDILMALAFGVTRSTDNETQITLKRTSLMYTLPLK